MMQRCHTAAAGEMCHDKVRWAMVKGVREHPSGEYGGLTAASSFEDFQAFFHREGYGDCPAPCARKAELGPGAAPGACLCLLDVDRTLTGRPEAAPHCPGNKALPGVPDRFGGGNL